MDNTPDACNGGLNVTVGLEGTICKSQLGKALVVDERRKRKGMEL